MLTCWQLSFLHVRWNSILVINSTIATSQRIWVATTNRRAWGPKRGAWANVIKQWFCKLVSLWIGSQRIQFTVVMRPNHQKQQHACDTEQGHITQSPHKPDHEQVLLVAQMARPSIHQRLDGSNLSGTGDSQRDSRESIRANHSQSKPLFL